MEYSFEVYNKTALIFCSAGKWLHPIFEFEEFLAANNYEPTMLLVKDKIIGRAAALLLVHLGVKTMRAGMLSEPGREVLDFFNIDYDYEKRVDRIQCRTEEMLQGEYNPENAYQLIKKLAGK